MLKITLCYSVIIHVDELFINGVFGPQIIINKEPTKPPPGRAGRAGWVHYNMENSPVIEREVWDVKRLLEVIYLFIV